MRLLLDTHVWIWMRANPSRLSADARRVLVDARTELVLSAASAWEIAIKVALGKLRLPCKVEEFVVTRARADRVALLPMTHLHVIEAAGLPLHHRDPFDRVLVAQARLERMPLLTADPLLAAYDVDLHPAV